MGKSSGKIFFRPWLLSQLGPIYRMWEATGNDLFLRPYIFHAHALYREILISLRCSSLGLVISRKNNKVEAFFTKKKLTRRRLTSSLSFKFARKCVGKKTPV